MMFFISSPSSLSSVWRNIIVCSFFAAMPVLVVSQSDPVPVQCGFDDIEASPGSSQAPCSHTHPLWTSDALHIPLSSARSLKVRANFIIIQKADGTGNFQDIPEHRAFLNDWLDKCNERFANLYGSSNCATLIQDVKIEIVPNWIFYADPTEEYWDNDKNSTMYECPNLPGWWLNPLDIDIRNSYPSAINVYLTTDGSAYDEMVLLGSTNNHTWDHYTWCSEFPSTSNLTKSSRIAINNMFLKYWWFQNHPTVVGAPFSTSRAWIVNEGIVLAHEFGHSFNLSHKDGCTSHLMSTFNTDRNLMRAIDAGTMHRYFGISSTRQFIDCEETYNHPNSILSDRIIQSDETWDLNIRLYSNIVVRTGSTLTITCQVLMPQEGLITVERGAKLIIGDGGKVTRANTCDADQFWRGIAVHGNSNLPQPDPNGMQDEDEAAILFLQGGGAIEGAVAVSTLFHPNVYAPEYYGGLIISDDFTFLDCRKGVEFLQYKFRNKSKFTETKFQNTSTGSMHTGVSIWDTDGIAFEECSFENLDVAGIRSLDAGYTVGYLNTFSYNLYGIYAEGSMPLNGRINVGFRGTVPGYRNVFHKNTVGVVGKGAINIDVSSNDFEDFDFGIALDGYATSEVVDNIFNGPVVGNQFQFTKDRLNLTLCNSYFDNLAGSNIVGRNTGFIFREEDFSTGSYDIFIEGPESNPGAVQLFQGSAGQARWNYFSSLNSENIKTSTTAPNNFTEQFIYYHPDPQLNGRVEPNCPLNSLSCGTQSNFTNDETGGGPFHNCDFAHSPDPFCISIECLDDIRETIAGIISEIGSSPSLSLQAELQSLYTNREYIVEALIMGLIDSNDWQSAEQILLDDLNTDNYRRLVALKLLQQEYTAVDSLINLFPITSSEDQYFIKAQTINLLRLSDPEFELSQQDSSALVFIANSATPEAGFAKVLLGVLTDRTFMPLLPSLENNNFVIPYNFSNSTREEVLTVYPNPATNIISVILPISKKEGRERLLACRSVLTGQNVWEDDVLNRFSVSIDTDKFSSGIYFLTLVEDDAVIGHQKIFILKN